MDPLLDQKVSEIAINNFAFIKLCQEFNIDFYCNGNATLKEALKNSDRNETEFLIRLKEVNDNKPYGFNGKIEDWPLDLLADYIQKTHHRFTDLILVQIKSAVNEYLETHHPKNENLLIFQEQLNLLAKELGGHMKKEELILFPFIRKMISARKEVEAPRFGSVQKPIDMMIHEHDTAYQLLVEIRRLFNNYENEFDVKSKYKDIVLKMSSLDVDLQHHLHLENNILFPKTVELEKNKVTS